MPFSPEMKKLIQDIIAERKVLSPDQANQVAQAIEKANAGKIANVPNTAKPVVKASMDASDLAKEANLSPNQNIVQKLSSGQDYQNKLKNLGLMGGAGAVGGAALMSGGSDANAAEMPMAHEPTSISVNPELARSLPDPASQSNEDSEPSPSVMDQLKQNGGQAIQTAKGYYDQLPQTVKDYVSGGQQMMAAPAAAMRNATYAAQTGGDMGNAAYQGLVNPDSAKTGADIADATGISDQHPNIKAALATAADFADPMDVAQELNPAEYSKLKALLGK